MSGTNGLNNIADPSRVRRRAARGGAGPKCRRKTTGAPPVSTVTTVKGVVYGDNGGAGPGWQRKPMLESPGPADRIKGTDPRPQSQSTSSPIGALDAVAAPSLGRKAVRASRGSRIKGTIPATEREPITMSDGVPDAVTAPLSLRKPKRGARGNRNGAGWPHSARNTGRAAPASATVTPLLVLLAALVDDQERNRIANQNRRRALVDLGVNESHPDIALLDGIVGQLEQIETKAVRRLEKAMCDHHLGPFVKSMNGIGYKGVARWLGLVGDPAWHAVEQRPRTVGELWAYCGLHTVDGKAPKRAKGQQSNWSTRSKTRAYLMAEASMKCPASPYRVVYLARREHTATTHPDWKPIHSHNDALRIVSKRIIRDLWAEDRKRFGDAPALATQPTQVSARPDSGGAAVRPSQDHGNNAAPPQVEL